MGNTKYEVATKNCTVFPVQIFWGKKMSFGIWHSKDNILILAQAKKKKNQPHTEGQLQDMKLSRGQ